MNHSISRLRVCFMKEEPQAEALRGYELKNGFRLPQYDSLDKH